MRAPIATPSQRSCSRRRLRAPRGPSESARSNPTPPARMRLQPTRDRPRTANRRDTMGSSHPSRGKPSEHDESPAAGEALGTQRLRALPLAALILLAVVGLVADHVERAVELDVDL